MGRGPLPRAMREKSSVLPGWERTSTAEVGRGPTPHPLSLVPFGDAQKHGVAAARTPTLGLSNPGPCCKSKSGVNTLQHDSGRREDLTSSLICSHRRVLRTNHYSNYVVSVLSWVGIWG